MSDLKVTKPDGHGIQSSNNNMSLSLVQLAQTLQNERILNPTKLDQINQESTPET